METNESRLKRYERLQRLVQHFWARWHREYLGELQTRSKWKTKSINYLKIGTIVLIKEDNTPPLKWHMGVIKNLHPGSDNVVRVVSLTMNGNTVKRPVSKICVFPIDNEHLNVNNANESTE